MYYVVEQLSLNKLTVAILKVFERESYKLNIFNTF